MIDVQVIENLGIEDYYLFPDLDSVSRKALDGIAVVRFKIKPERGETTVVGTSCFPMRISSSHPFRNTFSCVAASLQKIKFLIRPINDKEEPNIELCYRLEKHSGELINALLWWNLIIKKQGFILAEDEKTRRSEQEKVKNALRA